MDRPLVTVICLCYNHETFIEEAVNSVLTQSYKNIEIIIVDDASTDGSVQIIQGLVRSNPNIQFLPLSKNLGNCKAFNCGLSLAKGEFVIDFATDDVMLPQKIEDQVNFFLTLDTLYGVVFTNALYIDEKGNLIKNHFDYLKQKHLLSEIPEGDIYSYVIAHYFIPSPSMMVRKKVFDDLHGYDENLSYEDFDFWIRSSRNYKYAFLNEVTIKVRRSAKSMSSGWYVKGDSQLYSTYLVCKKIKELNRTQEEIFALSKRLKFEIRQSVFSNNHYEAKLFYELLKDIGYDNTLYSLLNFVNSLKLPLRGIRKLYHYLRFNN